MKWKQLTALGLIAIAIATILFRCRSVERSPHTPEESAPPLNPQSFEQIENDKVPKRKLDSETLGKLMDLEDSKGSQRLMDEMALTHDDWEAFMAEHGRDATTLAAAARNLDDPKLFAELAKNHGNDPLAITAILELLSRKPEEGEVKEWVRRLKKFDPENGIAALYGARIAFANDDPVAAYLELQEVESALFADFYKKAQNRKVREAYTHAGWGDDDALILSQNQVTYPSIRDFIKLSEDLAAALDGAREAGNEGQAKDLWAGGIAAAKLMRDIEGMEVIGLFVSHITEEAIYEHLDALDLAPGEENLVIEWMAESEARMEVFKGFSYDNNFSESDWRTYWRIVEAEGTLAAMRWVTEQQATR